MKTHVHLVVMDTSRGALHDAMRYLFATMARTINARLGRKGSVFPDRFASRVARSAVELFRLVGYVARNPKDAELVVRRDHWDRGLRCDSRAVVENHYLRGVFGTDKQAFFDQIELMRSERLPYRALPDVRQMTLTL